MRPISNQNRIGRLSVKPDADIQFTVPTRSGASWRFTVVNVSPSGLGAIGTALEFDDTGFAVGDVIPGSRLRFLTHDIALGRVIWRYINRRDEQAFCGFSLIDVKIPLDGPISWLLTGHIPKNDRPSASASAPGWVSRATFREDEPSPRVRRFSIYNKDWVAR
jgi:hypothetical protein